MAIQINSATISPNPVNLSSTYTLLVSITEYLLENIPLLDITNDSVYDVSNNPINVINEEITSISYTSNYSSAEMNFFILSVGV